MTAERILGKLFIETDGSTRIPLPLDLPNLVHEPSQNELVTEVVTPSSRDYNSSETPAIVESSCWNQVAREGSDAFQLKVAKWRPLVHKFINRCAEFAGKSSVPILEGVGDQEASVFQRILSFLCFIVCVFSMAMLCWFLRDETISNPINDGVKGIPIYDGPFPAVAVYTGKMIRTEFLEETLRQFEQWENSSIADDEKKNLVALAYILGQLLFLEEEAPSERYLKPIQNFITRANLSVIDTPKNDLTDPAVKVAASLVNRNIRKCSDIIRNCRFGHRSNTCDNFFAPALTSKGIGCVFNYVPGYAMERKKTLRSALSHKPKNVYIKDDWMIMDMDEIVFSEKNDGIGFHQQIHTGERHGLVFEVVDSRNKSYNSFKVAMQNPRDPFLQRLPDYKLSYGHQHLLSLDVISRYTAPNLRAIPREKRNCSFYNEAEIGIQKGYTYTKCLESVAAYLRPCSLITEPEPGESLCHPNLLKGEDMWLDDDDMLYSFSKQPCQKSCNEVKYLASPQILSDYKITKEEISQPITLVRIFFRNDEVEVRVKTLRRFVAEEIGIVLGMLGFCNDITLPKVFFFLVKVLTSSFTYAWKWAVRTMKRNPIYEDVVN